VLRQRKRAHSSADVSNVAQDQAGKSKLAMLLLAWLRLQAKTSSFV
jgi:hypothetical protein